MRVMISTVHIKKAVLVAIPKLSAEKIIFLIDTDTKNKANLEEIKLFFGESIPVEFIKVSAYDVSNIASLVAQRIDEEYEKKNEVILHITEGRKTLAIGAMYGAYARAKKVLGIYYITEENNELISLPVLEFKLNPTKLSILQEFKKGNKNIKGLAQKLGKTEAMIYAHIADLKKGNYISKDETLTCKGELIIL